MELSSASLKWVWTRLRPYEIKGTDRNVLPDYVVIPKELPFGVD